MARNPSGESSPFNLTLVAAIALVTIVALVALVMSTRGGFPAASGSPQVAADDAAAADTNIGGQATKPRPGCTDSDGGQNFFIQGVTVDPQRNTGKDTCWVWNNVYTLVEYYCLKDHVANMTFECKAGCVDGACTNG